MKQGEFNRRVDEIDRSLGEASAWVARLDSGDTMSLGYAIIDLVAATRDLACLVREELDDIRIHVGYPRVSR